MKLIELKIANELAKEIKELEQILDNSKSQKCEWILFTFGNGSNKSTVCEDLKIIEKVRALIVEETELKLSKLKSEFEKL